MRFKFTLLQLIRINYITPYFESRKKFATSIHGWMGWRYGMKWDGRTDGQIDRRTDLNIYFNCKHASSILAEWIWPAGIVC